MVKIAPEPSPEPQATLEKPADGEDDEAEAETPALKPVSCCALLRFASCCDKFNFIIGLVFTSLNAVGMPAFALVLGEFIHTGFMVCTKHASKDIDHYKKFTVGTPPPDTGSNFGIPGLDLDKVFKMDMGSQGSLGTEQLVGIV